MSLLKNSFLKIPKLNIYQLMKYSITAEKSTDWVYFESKLTQEESTKVLKTLNESDPIELSRYKISQRKIKGIENLKNKVGPFQSLGDILEIDGFSENMLKTVCKNIINENTVDIKPKPVRGSKRSKCIVTPPIDGLAKVLKSATGIHLSPIGVSWAKLSREENELTQWKFEDFRDLPKKILPSETFMQAIRLLKKIPPSDVYIFESTEPLKPTNQVSMGYAFNHQIALTSMLLALLNTSVYHNSTLRIVEEDDSDRIIAKNRVYFLKSKLSARLFKTLIGMEEVSTLIAVDKLIQNDSEDEGKLQCEPVKVEEALKNSYNSYSSSDKHFLGQALLLVVSFMNLCVKNDPNCLKAINYNKSKN